MQIKSLEPLGYPLYAIREDGVVINVVRVSIVKPFLTKGGYLRVSLNTYNGLEKKEFIHRLVSKLFVKKERAEQAYVNHINSNKLDNHFKNLEWITAKENTKHSWESGTSFPNRKKLTEEQMFLILNLTLPTKDIALYAGVSEALVCYHRRVNGVFVKEEV